MSENERQKAPTVGVHPVVGRDLDAEIAERLLGWKSAPVPPDYDGKNAGEVLTRDGRIPEGYVFSPRGAVHRALFVPAYHRDLGEVLMLARALGHMTVPLQGGSEAEMATAVCRWLLTPNAQDHAVSKQEKAK